MKFDLHVHTTLSACSQLTVREIRRHARSKGLDGVCITDHDSVDCDAMRFEGVQEDGLCLLFGLEYATPQGDFLVFCTNMELPKGLTADELFELVDARQGVAIAAHPFRSGRSTNRALLYSGRCSIIEGVNGRNREMENLAAIQLAEGGRAISLVAGSDAHSLDELGRNSTRFADKIACRQELIDALRQKQFSILEASTPSAQSPPATVMEDGAIVSIIQPEI